VPAAVVRLRLAAGPEGTGAEAGRDTAGGCGAAPAPNTAAGAVCAAAPEVRALLRPVVRLGLAAGPEGSGAFMDTGNCGAAADPAAGAARAAAREVRPLPREVVGPAGSEAEAGRDSAACAAALDVPPVLRPLVRLRLGAGSSGTAAVAGRDTAGAVCAAAPEPAPAKHVPELLSLLLLGLLRLATPVKGREGAAAAGGWGTEAPVTTTVLVCRLPG
jgi:hypothetical protein